MRFYIVAGEASGDLIGGLLISALKKINPAIDIYAWGGEKMEEAGAIIRKHYRDLAFMGFAEVVKHLPEIMKNFSFCKEDILNFKPEAIIFIDYPGFNMRMARWAKKHSFSQNWKIIYYVAPQVWAWKERRVQALKRDVDLMLCILPFEKDFFAPFHFHVEFVGHPLLDVIDHFKKLSHQIIPTDKPILALLPGSRKQEIEKNLPIMLAAALKMPEYTSIIAAVNNQPLTVYTSIISVFERLIPEGSKNIQIIQGNTYKILNSAHLAAVKSGTSTLETALFNVPQVVCYKGGVISYQIAKRVVKVPFIALPNLISGKKIVEELIQTDFTSTGLVQALLLANQNRLQITSEYEELKKQLGENGSSKRAALRIMEFLSQKL